MLFFLGTGGYIKRNYIQVFDQAALADPLANATTFFILEEKKPPVVEKIIPEVKQKESEPVIDLTIQRKIEHNVEITKEQSEPERKEEVRPVYGLKKVYSKG